MATSIKFESYAMPVAIVLSALILGGSLAYSAKMLAVSGAFGVKTVTTGTAPTAGTAAQKPAVDVKNVKTANEPYIGQANAPVVVAYWSDFQCPFCKRYEADVVPNIISDYVNKGKVKIIFKDFAFLGADSQTIANVGRAVWQVAPGKYYAWRKHMFENQGRENSGWATKDVLTKLATDVLGADFAGQVMTLADSNKAAYQSQISADKTEGGTFGVSGTPSVVIGKQLIVGAQDYSQIKAAIEAVK